MTADDPQAARTDGHQARWNTDNQDLREQILEAATFVLAESESGTELHVEQIAERAGLSRSEVDRHFIDLADFDIAVQGHILELLRTELVPVLSFEGTPIEIIGRVVGTYVGWATANPALHEFAQVDPPGPHPSQLETALAQLAGQVEDLITVGVEVLNVRLDADEVAALDPLVFGLVGAVLSSVRRWLARPERRPDEATFVALVTEALWEQLAGMARQRGVELDPEVPVEQLLDAVLDQAVEG